MVAKYCIILLAIFLIGCTDGKKTPVTVYNEDAFYKLNPRIVDTACVNGERRAEKDVENGVLVLYKKEFYQDKSYFSYAEMAKELSVLKIRFDTTTIISASGKYPCRFRENCYEQKMTEKVFSVIRRSQIDTLVKKIQKRYVKEHPYNVYSFKDCAGNWGTKEEKLFYAFRTEITEKLDNNFVYPKGYKPEINRSKSLVSFIIRKDGTPGHIIIKSFFINPENESYDAYFEKSISDYIMKSDLRIPTTSGIPVNCQMNIVLIHK